MITMYDSTDAGTIPHGAKVAAGYINGQYLSYDPIRQRVPHATNMSITCNSHTPADIVDAEDGDVPVEHVAGWVQQQHARGVARPIVYANASTMAGDRENDGKGGILAALRQAGIARSSVRLWSAHYPRQSKAELQQMGKDHPAQLTALYEQWAHICGPATCNQVPVAMDGTQWAEWSYNPDVGKYVNLDQSYLVDSFLGEPPTPYLCQGQKSLNGLSQQLDNPVSEILRLTAEHSPGGVYHSGMAAYINGVFAADKEKVPQGITVYHPAGNGVQAFNSHGTQTLQGLALAFHCLPSDVVQCTAENSPGAVFSKEMADYLNAVFGRSTTHVPSGVHLFYQK
ncbi:MAG TPA: hypothetical protein VIZ20_02120 [Streptosporangiaceae bacterium]